MASGTGIHGYGLFAASGSFMKFNLTATIVFFALPSLSACTADAFNRGMFAALQQKQCLDTTGVADCDRQPKRYDAYRRQRQIHLDSQAN